jgi:hypothetical protein
MELAHTMTEQEAFRFKETERMKRYRAANREKINANRRRWYRERHGRKNGSQYDAP